MNAEKQLDWRTSMMLREYSTRQLCEIIGKNYRRSIHSIRAVASAKRALKIRLAHFTKDGRAEINAEIEKFRAARAAAKVSV